MTVSASVLTGGAGLGNSVTTASISVAADRVQLVFFSVVLNNRAAAGSFPSCSVSGLNRTWELIRRQLHMLESSQYYSSLNVFRATGAAATGTLTLTCADTSARVWDVVELTGADTGGTNGANAIVQSNGATGSGTALSVTLSAFAQANNAALFYGGLGNASNLTFTPGSGLTELSDRGASYVSHQISFRNSSQTTLAATSSGTGYGENPWGAIGIEIADAPSGGSSSLPLLMHHYSH